MNAYDLHNMPWLESIVIKIEKGGFICLHNRQLTICTPCGDKAEEEYKKYRSK